MAFNFSKFNVLKNLDAKGRVFFLFATTVAVIFIIYLGVRFLWGDGQTIGTSNVAGVPVGIQSIPGGELSPEYAKALQQANIQAAQQAKLTGSSAIPTMMNVEGATQTIAASGCIICPDDAANVRYKLDDWVRQGKLAPDIADTLKQLSDKSVSIEEYAQQLSQLVKEGKLTPEQARELLEVYKKQRSNNLLKDSAKLMDSLIVPGKLPLEVANQLLMAQKNKMPVVEYATMLQDAVKQGKISPDVAQQLLAQYSQQQAKEAALANLANLHRMAQTGEITPEVEKNLADLQTRNVPLDTYVKTLDQLVAQGKITPAAAAKLLDQYKVQKTAIGPIGMLNQLLRQAEAAAYAEIEELLKQGKISGDVASILTDLLQKNVSLEAHQTAIDQLVQQKKLTPDIAKLKVDDYRLVKKLRELIGQLAGLQANNVNSAVYANALKRAVQLGVLTPDQAAQLMKEYQATTIAPTDVALGNLQQRLQAEAEARTGATPSDFAVAQVQAQQITSEDRQANIQALMTAMSSQAQQLIGSWQPAIMLHKAATPVTKSATTKDSGTSATSGYQSTSTAPVIIKGGSVYFAVLDTAVNSDYPDSPIMATIVEGKYKGAKLLGKLMTSKGPAGQMDRVAMNFTIMNFDEWPTSKAVTAYAIDPDTARSVMASQVDYHYMQRFGAMMATSFLQGYAGALTTSGGTTSQTLIGTTTTNPALNPQQKIMVGLGQVGQTLGTMTQGYANLPPTVKVDSGVGLGILFMSDIT